MSLLCVCKRCLLVAGCDVWLMCVVCWLLFAGSRVLVVVVCELCVLCCVLRC